MGSESVGLWPGCGRSRATPPKRRRAGRQDVRMHVSDDASARTHFDLIVVGGGPAGYGAALYGSAAGLDIALVEKDKVGGTCLHRGCIPAKELLETAATFRT